MVPPMTDPKKSDPVQFVTQIESVRLANWMIRTAWKTSAGLIVLIARLIAFVVLRIARVISRRRLDW
jgi:uncharacterized membrane protein